jgi:hypothetical protein
MTFLIGKDGVVYEKDLGKGTEATAKVISEYNPGDGWKRVSDDERSEKTQGTRTSN